MLPRPIAAALCALLVPVCGAAQAPEPRAQGVGEGALPVLTPAWFDLGINDVPKGQVLLRLGEGDAWIDVDDLARAGVEVAGGIRIAVGGRSLVSLRSLGPSIAFILDEEETQLRVSASRAVLGRTTLDLNPKRRPEKLRTGAVPSAFLNVGARADDWEQFSSSADLGASAGPAVLLSTATLSSDGGFLRGLTVAHVDDARALVRYSAGEFFASSTDPLGGSALLLGISAGREFSLDPYVLRDPYPRTSLFVESPSTLEVWVGDTLVRRSQVAPGTLDIENLPLNAGVNEVRTVLRDAFGREQSASSFFLMGSNLLSPGVVDWGLSAGFERVSGIGGEIDYGPAVAMGRWRAGLTRLVTLGARVEASTEVLSGGLITALATPAGDLEAGVGASRAGAGGAAGFLGLRARPLRQASLVAQLRLTSDRYANASLDPASDRAAVRALLGANVSPVPHLSILGELSAVRQRDAGEGVRGSLRGSWTLGGGRVVALSAAVGKQSGQDRTWDLSLTYTMQLPSAHSLEVAATAGSDRGAAWVTASRNLGAESGVGYRVQARAGDDSMGALDVRGQASFGTAAFTERWGDPFGVAQAHHESLEAAAGLVLIGGEVHPSRPIDGSYTLLVLDHAPGVRASVGGQPAGRTDSNGRLFIPGLLPYYGNRITIRDSDLPLDFRVNETERYVAPRYRGGTVEAFDVGPTLVVAGRLLLTIDEKDLLPEWGEIAVELPAGRVVSPIGSGGEFWLEGLTPGRHEALVRWAGRLCRMTFEVGQGTGVVDLGLQRCTQLLAGSGGLAPVRPY